MATEVRRMRDLIDLAKKRGPIRLAVIGAGQELVLDSLQEVLCNRLPHGRCNGSSTPPLHKNQDVFEQGDVADTVLRSGCN